MSYSEENNQVVLRMSREDYNVLMGNLDALNVIAPDRDHEEFVDRLNSGNPNYTPYPTGESK